MLFRNIFHTKIKKMWTVNAASSCCKSEWKLNLTRRLQKQSDIWQRVGEGFFFLIALHSLLFKLSLSNYIFVSFVLCSSHFFHLSDVRFFRTNLTSDKVVAETLEHLTRCGRGHFLCYHIAVAISFTFHLNCFSSHFLIMLQSFPLSNCKRFLITLNNGEKKLRCGSSLEQTNIRQRMPFIVIYFFPPLCQ